MQGQCPNCKGLFETQPEWIGKNAECPHCHQSIVIEPYILNNCRGGVCAGDLGPADVGLRFVALLIDGLAVGIAVLILGFVVGVVFGLLFGEAGIGIAQVLCQLLGLVIGLGYEVYFLTQHGATPGKMCFGIKVQHLGQNLTVPRAIGRYFARQLSGIICGIGYILAFFNPERKALHDNLCDTLVVRTR